MTRLMLDQLLPSGGLLALVIARPRLSKPASHAKLFAV